MLEISTTLWLLTIAAIVVVILGDLLWVARRPHVPSLREDSIWIAFYVGLAVLFGIGLLVTSGPRTGGEFFAGWLTEYSLSVDNLFVFVIIMARFRVPRENQQAVLLVGIVLALVMRGIFIALGSAAITRFSWVFYLFGAFLVYTAVNLAKEGLAHGGEDPDDGPQDYEENRAIRLVRRVIPTTTEYDGARLRTTVSGHRLFTPMLVVMVAIGTTDLLFALDSIPAIFGLTKEPYIVFTANAFALMGLRQLYFLLGGLLDRLVYLGLGLSIVLGFIGLKLVMEALHDNTLPFVNGGRKLESVPQIPIWLSLAIILLTLAVTTVASLAKVRRDPGARKRLPEGHAS